MLLSGTNDLCRKGKEGGISKSKEKSASTKRIVPATMCIDAKKRAGPSDVNRSPTAVDNNLLVFRVVDNFRVVDELTECLTNATLRLRPLGADKDDSNIGFEIMFATVDTVNETVDCLVGPTARLCSKCAY